MMGIDLRRVKDDPEEQDGFQVTELYESWKVIRRDLKYGSVDGNTEERDATLWEAWKVSKKMGNDQVLVKGEILCEWKKLRQGNFQRFIEDNLDISYETALNLMRVFKLCSPFPNLLDGVNISILYRIAAPSFDKEFGDWLILDHPEMLKGMKVDKLEELKKRYKEKGLAAVDNIFAHDDRYARASWQLRQWKNLVRETINDLKSRLERVEKEIIGRAGPISEELMTAGAEPEAAKLILAIIRWSDQNMESGEKLLEDIGAGLERLKNADRPELERAVVVPSKKVHCGENEKVKETNSLSLVPRRKLSF